MRSFVVGFAALGGLIGCASPTPGKSSLSNDGEEILGAVVASATRSKVSANITHCIARDLYQRPRILQYLHAQSFRPEGKWIVHSSGKVRDVTGAEAAEINAAARILIGWKAPGLPGPIPSSAIKPPWRFQRSGETCGYQKSFSFALVSGDWAFVEETSYCGELCGSGWLYALRREDDHWRIVGSQGLWIS